MDSYIEDELLKMLLDILGSTDMDMVKTGGSKYSKVIKHLYNVLLLIAETNMRMGEYIFSTIVTNKSSIRDFVLSKFKVLQITKNYLRGYDFAIENLFGDLPESFQSLVISEQGRKPHSN